MDPLRRLLALSMVSLVLLSGCFVEKDDGDAATDAAAAVASGTSSGAPAKAGSPSGPGAVPAIDNVTSNVTGLQVTLAISAHDDSGLNVTYSVAFGDNATANGTLAKGVAVNQTVQPQHAALVGNATHVYAAAGTYNVTVTVSDGKASANRTVAVTVADAAPTGPPMDPITMSGSCTMDDASHTFEVTPGQAFIHGTLSKGPTGVDLDWSILDPSGSEKDTGGDFDPVDGGESDLQVDHPVAGTWTIQVSCFIGVAASYDFTLTFH